MKLLSEHNQEFRKLLDLAIEDELVIFAGAGCSIEAGLPNWRGLVSRYINLALLMQSGIEVDPERPKLSQDIIPQKLLERFGDPPHLAIIADEIVGAYRRHEVLNLALYPDRQEPTPGPTAKEIAKLYRARLQAGRKTYIVTTNYDPLLEVALNEYVRDRLPNIGDAHGFGLKALFQSETPVGEDSAKDDSGDGEPAGVTMTRTTELAEELERRFHPGNAATTDAHIPTVFHLHGAIDFREGEEGIRPIVLTEKDYASYEYAAQLALAPLLKKPCLMIGLGLQDHDVVNALYYEMEENESDGSAEETSSGEQSARIPRYVIALDEMKRVDEGAETNPVAEQVRRLESQRLQLLGLTPLKHLKSYSQIPQVIHEMGVATTLANEHDRSDCVAYWNSQSESYGKRLSRWKEDFTARYLPIDETDEQREKFVSEQQRVSDEIDNALREILEEHVGATVVSDELAIHLWARSNDEDSYEVFLWCGNEYARRRGVPLGLNRGIEESKFNLALRQMFRGVSTRGFWPAEARSRWAQVMAVPIISLTRDARHKYGRLLLGVATLSTNLPPELSDLSEHIDERKDLLNKIEDRLFSLGCKLLVEDVDRATNSDQA